MATQEWQRIKEIFNAALCQDAVDREDFIKKECGDDKALLVEIQSLLGFMDSAESFMEKPAVVEVADVIVTAKISQGKSFGHYEIIKQIGVGGMGEVYLAKDKKLDRKVALKVLRSKFSRHEINRSRFIQEAKAVSALNHPNILVIHEINETEGTHFIVSEYVEGRTLREIIAKSPMKISEMLDISLQIANALAAAHAAHIMHRDIKPENIMLRTDGYVKILDFGLAKLVKHKESFISLVSSVRENQTAKGIILGTVGYMSPEQAKGERIDERTDIFSLGIVMYEMLAGKNPFEGNSISETWKKLLDKEPEALQNLRADVPDELQKIIFNDFIPFIC